MPQPMNNPANAGFFHLSSDESSDQESDLDEMADEGPSVPSNFPVNETTFSYPPVIQNLEELMNFTGISQQASPKTSASGHTTTPTKRAYKS